MTTPKRPLICVSLVIAVMGVACSTRPLPRPLPTTHWQRVGDFVETYNRCIRDADGKMIIEVMHATNNPADLYDVFENGRQYGEYETLELAKRAAIERHSECKEPRP